MRVSDEVWSAFTKALISKYGERSLKPAQWNTVIESVGAAEQLYQSGEEVKPQTNFFLKMLLSIMGE